MESAQDTNVKSVERLNPTTVKVTVELSSEQVKSQEKTSIARIRQNAKIQGFRPGKAPDNLIRQKYKDELHADVLTELLDKGLMAALDQAKVVPITRPQVKILKDPNHNGGTLEFDAEFEIHPEFELPNYKGVTLTTPKLTVEDKEVDETIERIREQLGVLEPLGGDTPSKGCFAVVEMGMEWLDEATPKKEAPKMFTIELSEGKLLPELETGLMSMKVGGRKEIEAKFPDDFGDPNMAGKRVKFDCHLVELKVKRLPPVNDALAEQLKKAQPCSALEAKSATIF